MCLSHPYSGRLCLHLLLLAPSVEAESCLALFFLLLMITYFGWLVQYWQPQADWIVLGVQGAAELPEFARVLELPQSCICLLPTSASCITRNSELDLGSHKLQLHMAKCWLGDYFFSGLTLTVPRDTIRWWCLRSLWNMHNSGHPWCSSITCLLQNKAVLLITHG